MATQLPRSWLLMTPSMLLAISSTRTRGITIWTQLAEVRLCELVELLVSMS